MKPLDNVLDRLRNARRESEGYLASCPVVDHGQGRGDANPSLGLREAEDGKVLVNCRAGCDTKDVLAAIGLEMKDLFPPKGEGGVTPRKTVKPSLTLAEYAEAKKLPLEFLEDMGLRDVHYVGSPAVRIPYLNVDGTECGTRFRCTMEKSEQGADQRFRWRQGDKAVFYGLHRLGRAREEGYVAIAEGESDAQTLWLHGIPAVGVPGAKNFRSEWASELDGIDRIYVVVEPDSGGEELWERIAASPLRERLYRVDLEGAKDVSELHLADRGPFPKKFKDALDKSVAWLDLAESEEKERAREAWAACEDLATETDILASFARDLKDCGVAGDTDASKLLYLAVNGRHLRSKMLVNVAVKGPSSSGKSYTTEKVLAFHPEEAYYALSGMSERALAYGEEDLAHRFLYLAEDAGMSGDFQTYLIRTLLSEGRLRYVTVEKTGDGLRPRLIEREGPTGLLVTTTRSRLHPENETRMFGVTVDDRAGQTRRVLESIADEDREDPDLTRWHALQRWIASGRADVTIPYAKVVARLIPHTLGVRLRRDFSSLLNLIRSHALLHQVTRERDDRGRIIATLDDYAVVHGLVKDLVAETLEAAVSDAVRDTVGVVRKIHEETGEPTTIKKVGERLKLSKMPTWSRVQRAMDGGYVSNLEDRKGRPARLVPGDPLPEDVEVLPTPHDVAKEGRLGKFYGLTGFGEVGTPLPREAGA